MKRGIKYTALLLVLSILFTGHIMVFAETDSLDAVIKDTGAYIIKTVKKPQVDSVGGEWAVIALARSDYDVPDSFSNAYYKNAEAYVKKAKGILHDKKYTEYSRVILGLTAGGYDPTNVGGYDLTMALGDFEKTIWQGINGPVFALIALDSGNYAIPENREAVTQATRKMYVDEILSRQLSDGGFSLFGGSADAGEADYKSDPDITAMALQALAEYQDRADVKKVTEEALACLSKLQNGRGGYASWNEGNIESVAQVIVALTELGIPLEDPRFIKDGNTLLDNLMDFYVKGKGFKHTLGDRGSNQMATEQAFYAMVAAKRAMEGKSSLYRMTDVEMAKLPAKEEMVIGLPDKHEDINFMPVTYPGKTFEDIKGHEAGAYIEALAERGIISGKEEKTFDADATMTRAEFAAIVVRALGLTPKSNNTFGDVSPKQWYAPYVGTANFYGIVGGKATAVFDPLGTITREEAGVMAARTAKLAGMETSLFATETRDMLAQFTDYISSSDWARPSLAFCYKEGILDQEDIDIRPKAPIKRYEIAKMLYKLLESANLL